MKRGATAPEVFIAVSLCEGVVHPMDSGLGGGFQAVVYNESCKTSYYLNAREKSPKHWPQCGNNIDRTQLQDFIGVPSVLKGYEFLYTNRQCGYRPQLKWADLFTPSMKLAYTGWIVSPTFANILPLFDFGDLFRVQQDNTIINPRLGNFIKQIINDGPKSSLYRPKGYLNKAILTDLGRINKFVTKSDITLYNVTVGRPIKCKFMGYRVETTNLPGGGRLICLALSVLDNLMAINRGQNPVLKTRIGRFVLMAEMQRHILTMHNHLKQYTYTKLMSESKTIAKRILKKFKTGSSSAWTLGSVTKYGRIKLPDLEHVPNPFGTTNVVVKINGVTIVTTSTVNWSFGSQHYHRKYGFFYNNQLSDFNKLNPNHPNYCKSNATPQSSISGTYFINQHNRTVFMVGAAGGKKILSSVFSVIFNYFIGGMTLQESVDYTRCLINLRHDTIACEADLDHAIQRQFHKYYPNSRIEIAHESGYSAITAATSLRGRNEAVFDKRRGGKGYVLKDFV